MRKARWVSNRCRVFFLGQRREGTYDNQLGEVVLQHAKAVAEVEQGGRCVQGRLGGAVGGRIRVNGLRAGVGTMEEGVGSSLLDRGQAEGGGREEGSDEHASEREREGGGKGEGASEEVVVSREARKATLRS